MDIKKPESIYIPLRLIDGHYANSNNIIARCHLLTHRGYLTKSLVKSHDCINKKCPFMEKIKKEYWKALDEAKQEKKDNRVKGSSRLRRPTTGIFLSVKRLRTAETFTSRR